MTTTTQTQPFTIDEVHAAAGIHSLERIWERIDEAPEFPHAGPKARTVRLVTEGRWETVAYWTHVCAKVVRAVAVWSAMTPDVRRMADPIQIDGDQVSLRFVAAMADVHHSVAHAALVDLVNAGLIPGETGHDFGRDLVTVTPALLA